MVSAVEVAEGTQYQLSWQKLIYTIDVSARTSSPTDLAVNRVVKESDGTDVKATVMAAGSPTASGGVITLPALGDELNGDAALTAGESYRVEVAFSHGGNSDGFYVTVYCPL